MAPRLSATSLPFEGLPMPWLVLFCVAFALIVVLLAWTGGLFVLGRRVRRQAVKAPPEGPTGEFLWVFLVPALNEEVTIADSLERLLAIRLERSRVLVVDDGSDDDTAAILVSAARRDPRLAVLTRRAPDARRGKAAALNAGYRALPEAIGDWPRERAIVVVVDADGRLHPDAPARAAVHFDDPAVGGVQALVRIYNRSRPLAWLQDVEFSIYAYLFQAGRTPWGTAGMGGNGQFNRLSALDRIAGEEGPWQDRLTEDQDLGLRLILDGWRGHQELGATVDQQGLPGLRKLYRQRTRWAQGNIQAIAHLPAVLRAPLPLASRLELALYLLNPGFQAFIGFVLVSAIVLAVTGEASFWDEGEWWQLGLFYVLGFGGVVFGCLARGAARGPLGLVGGYLLSFPYALYSWILWPALLRAAVRQLLGRGGWAKTDREPLSG